jgi:hypothetical protein
MAGFLPKWRFVIMADFDNIVRDRQKAIRREIDRRGIAIKAVQLDGEWNSPSTVLSYFPADENAQPATMSVSALYRLIDRRALPLDLLSLLLPPGFTIVRVPEAIDHDQIAEALGDYLRTKHAAHHPESEAGPAIGPKERAALDSKVVAFPTGRAA